MVHGVAKNQMLLKQLSTAHAIYTRYTYAYKHIHFLIHVQSIHIKTAVNLVPHKNCSEFSLVTIYIYSSGCIFLFM